MNISPQTTFSSRLLPKYGTRKSQTFLQPETTPAANDTLYLEPSDPTVRQEHSFTSLEKAELLPKPVLESWKSSLKTTPADFVRRLLHGTPVSLKRAEICLEQERGRTSAIDCNLAIQCGRSQRWAGRLINHFTFPEDGQPRVHPELLNLEPSIQGRGLARQILANSRRLYQQLGVSKVDICASLTVGGYAWAKYGFKPHPGSETRKLLSEVSDRVAQIPLPKETRSHLNRLIKLGRPEVVWALSDLRHPKVTVRRRQLELGKALLLGTSWKGSLDLNDPAALARFEHYVEGRKAS